MCTIQRLWKAAFQPQTTPPRLPPFHTDSLLPPTSGSARASHVSEESFPIGNDSLDFEDLPGITHFYDVIDSLWHTFNFELGVADSDAVIAHFNLIPTMLATRMIQHSYTTAVMLYFALREAMIHWSRSRMHHQHMQTLVNLATISTRSHKALAMELETHAKRAQPFFQICDPQLRIENIMIPAGNLDRRLRQQGPVP